MPTLSHHSYSQNLIFLRVWVWSKANLFLSPVPQVTLHSVHEPYFQKKVDEGMSLPSETFWLIVYSYRTPGLVSWKRSCNKQTSRKSKHWRFLQFDRIFCQTDFILFYWQNFTLTSTKKGRITCMWRCESYLYPQWFHGGPRRRQVLQVSRPLIGEYCPSCLVLSIPLDRPSPVQEVFVGVVATECQEIPSFSHLLNADVPGSLWDQPNVDVA